MNKKELLDKYGHLEEAFKTCYGFVKCIRDENNEWVSLMRAYSMIDSYGSGLFYKSLELKPLSSISKKELIQVITIEYPYYDEDRIEQFSYTTIITDGSIPTVLYQYESGHSESNLSGHSLDYLRSRGYLLPFMGITVEELVIMDWAKYKKA